METKVFKVIRSVNGRGLSNLLLITGEAIPDIKIGSALLVPIAQGIKDPIQVSVVVDKNGIPVRTNIDTCIVTEYIYKPD